MVKNMGNMQKYGKKHGKYAKKKIKIWFFDTFYNYI